jgi:hypothetical protein
MMGPGLKPCTSSENMASSKCRWYDNPSVLSMHRKGWYSTAEPLVGGTVVLIGGFVNGGHVNRNMSNVDPRTSHGLAEPSYEFFPSRGEPRDMQFMVQTSGLNSYAHAFLMPSGKNVRASQLFNQYVPALTSWLRLWSKSELKFSGIMTRTSNICFPT